MVYESFLDHFGSLLDHFAHCTFNYLPMLLWINFVCGAYPLSHFLCIFFCAFVCLLPFLGGKLNIWIISFNINWWVNLLLGTCML